MLIYPHPFIMDRRRTEMLTGLVSQLTGTEIREFTFEDAREPALAAWDGGA